MKVNVRLFASLREYVVDYDPGKGVDVEMEEGSTVEALIQTLRLPQNEASVIFINGALKKTTDPMNDQDLIKIFSPLSGG